MHEYLSIRELNQEDVTQSYVNWLNDPGTNMYLESRFQTHTMESVKAFVRDMLESKENILFGVYHGEKHVGNIKIGSIHDFHKHADVGLIIGKEYWGKGFATEAIGLVSEVAFRQLKLHKLYAGAYSCNKKSISAFLKNGWKIAGEQKEHCMVNGQYADCVLLEIIDRDYFRNVKE